MPRELKHRCKVEDRPDVQDRHAYKDKPTVDYWDAGTAKPIYMRDRTQKNPWVRPPTAEQYVCLDCKKLFPDDELA